MNAVMTGESVDAQHSSLQSSRDSLLQAAEVGSSPHSIVSDSQTASDHFNEAMYRSEPVNNGVPALLDQVNRLEEKMQSINQSAERAAVLMNQAFDNGKPVLYANSGIPVLLEIYSKGVRILHFPALKPYSNYSKYKRELTCIFSFNASAHTTFSKQWT